MKASKPSLPPVLSETAHPAEPKRVLNPLLLNADELVAYARRLNPARECLTAVVLRSFPGCSHYSDQEAEAILQAIDQLIAVLFELTNVRKLLTEVNPLTIPLPGETVPGTIPISYHPKNKAA